MVTYIVNPTEDQEKAVKAFLEALEVAFVRDNGEEGGLPFHVLKGIEQGMEDFEAGRYMTLDEFKNTLSISK